MDKFSEHANDFYKKILSTTVKYPIRSFKPSSEELVLIERLKKDYDNYVKMSLKIHHALEMMSVHS